LMTLSRAAGVANADRASEATNAAVIEMRTMVRVVKGDEGGGGG
jgi:hypothetical protein